ncbi:MAG: alpha/beta fold hydrolase [Desulfobacterales bacterium]
MIESEMHCRPISFFADGYRLNGTLHLPRASHPPVIIGSHGLLSSGESSKQRELARRCTAAGMAYFRFDHRGCGRSQGYFPEVTSLEGRVRDLVAAVRTIGLRADTGRGCGLFGSSMGGAVCLAAARVIGTDALVTAAAPVRSRFLDPFKNEQANGIENRRPRQLHFDLSETISGLRHVLVFHGDADEVVPYAHALEIIERLDAPKRLVRQKNGDHVMTDATHRETFLQEAVNWFASRLGITQERISTGHPTKLT